MNSIVNLVQNMAEEFDSTKDYESGDYVMHEGLLYLFSSSHTAGEFNTEEVIPVTLADIMKGTIISVQASESGVANFGNLYLLQATTSDTSITIDDTIFTAKAVGDGTYSRIEITNAVIGKVYGVWGYRSGRIAHVSSIAGATEIDRHEVVDSYDCCWIEFKATDTSIIIYYDNSGNTTDGGNAYPHRLIFGDVNSNLSGEMTVYKQSSSASLATSYAYTFDEAYDDVYIAIMGSGSAAKPTYSSHAYSGNGTCTLVQNFDMYLYGSFVLYHLTNVEVGDVLTQYNVNNTSFEWSIYTLQ